jgi:hypothetical protein
LVRQRQLILGRRPRTPISGRIVSATGTDRPEILAPGCSDAFGREEALASAVP